MKELKIASGNMLIGKFVLDLKGLDFSWKYDMTIPIDRITIEEIKVEDNKEVK